MKIRGNLVGTNQKPEKVMEKATNLTEEQKAQARANIGAGTVTSVNGNTPDENGNVRIEGGGSGVLIVTLDRSSPDIMTASHTSEQIYEHVMSGGTVMLETYPGNYKMLVNNNPSVSIFEYSDSVSDGKICKSYTEIDMYGTATEFIRYVPTVEKLTELEDNVGDIESALDSIIAIQNELIGGDDL